MNSNRQPAMREARLDDALAITEFLVGLGLAMPEGDKARKNHWAALWRDNPAVKVHGSGVALGWVIEDKGRIVGFFGNIPQVSYFDGQPVKVSSARAWAVHKDHRDQTPRLCETFFGQKGTDVVLISSASAPAGKRCLEFGGSPLPQPGYGEILYWVLDAGGFLRAGLRKKGYGGMAVWAGGILGAVALNAKMRLTGRRPFAPLQDVTPITVEEIDDAFDDLWARKLKEGPGRLLAARDAETLKWYFGLSQQSSETRVLCRRRGGRLEGYLVLVREDTPAIGLKRLKVADLFVAGDEADTVNALLAGAYEYGLARRCHVLEVIGLPETLRDIAMSHKPYSRPMPAFPFFFKALREDLKSPLAAADGWYVTAYDGDTALL